MDMKEATRTAREYITDLFAGEEIINLGLEEVAYDAESEQWRITFSFLRAGPENPWLRKAVSIDDASGEVVSLTDQLLQEPGSCCKPKSRPGDACCVGDDREAKREKIDRKNERFWGSIRGTVQRFWESIWRPIWRFFGYMSSGVGIGTVIMMLLQAIWGFEAGEVIFIPMLGLSTGAIVAAFTGDMEFRKQSSQNRRSQRCCRTQRLCNPCCRDESVSSDDAQGPQAHDPQKPPDGSAGTAGCTDCPGRPPLQV